MNMPLLLSFPFPMSMSGIDRELADETTATLTTATTVIYSDRVVVVSAINAEGDDAQDYNPEDAGFIEDNIDLMDTADNLLLTKANADRSTGR